MNSRGASLKCGHGLTELPNSPSMRAAMLLAGLVFFACDAGAGPAHVRTTGPLQSQPAPKAPVAGTIKAGTPVEIFERKGFWAHVRGKSETGWLKLDRLSLDSGDKANQIAALASGRTGSNNVVSASGGRGLDAANLASASPDAKAVAALADIAASERAAEQFARKGGLVTRRIDYLATAKSGRSPR